MELIYKMTILDKILVACANAKLNNQEVEKIILDKNESLEFKSRVAVHAIYNIIQSANTQCKFNDIVIELAEGI